MDIYLNFIGRFDVPVEYILEEDEVPEPQSPEEQQRAKWREYKRRECERKIQEKLAARDKSA